MKPTAEQTFEKYMGRKPSGNDDRIIILLMELHEISIEAHEWDLEHRNKSNPKPYQFDDLTNKNYYEKGGYCWTIGDRVMLNKNVLNFKKGDIAHIIGFDTNDMSIELKMSNGFNLYVSSSDIDLVEDYNNNDFKDQE
jgi:hypothetical protein